MSSTTLPRTIVVLACMWLVKAGTVHAALPSMPMPVNEEDSANYRRMQKSVLATRLLDDMEQTGAWSHHGHGEMILTDERAFQGKRAVRLRSPTKTDHPNKVTGRPFGEAVARRTFPGEDWTGSNRLSFRVYPDLPGFKVISMLVKLHNDGATKVPDAYNREGLNFFLLEPDKWNHVVWEIAHLGRDRVTALEFIYRLQGNEPGATELVCFDIDQLELQQVQPDHFEGWDVAQGKIAYNHSGYLPGSRKTALASAIGAEDFTVISLATGKPVLREKLRVQKTSLGEFQILDFTQLDSPGAYKIVAGKTESSWFNIGEDAWRSSIVKTINHFFCQRCGMVIPGIHDVCHRDWRALHDGRELFINGGWHDAGDLSQGLVNTAESAYSMFALAESLSGKDPAVSERLISEARWGLEWIHKTRFGDGFRVHWATMDYWTDGVLGTPDDTLGQVRNSSHDNFIAASTQAIAARLLKTSDPQLAAKSLELAREDWEFAVAKSQAPNLELASVGAHASMELFKATGERKYGDKAVALSQVILDSQQREYRNWTVPLTGFFYTGPSRDRILHYSHRGHEQAPVVALAELCAAFPNHPQWMDWYSAVVLHSEYLKQIARFTEPYEMLPASIYSVGESKDARFIDQVREGVRLDETHYLRRFPVWFDFRGNLGTILSQAKALSTAARLRGDQAALELAQRQVDWALGRNPFAQSLMYSEGHNYAPQYTAMSGNMAGMLPVGIQTREHRDLPYWPAANCYNYAEVWVHPSSRWLWLMADFLAPPVRKITDSLASFELSHRTEAEGAVMLVARLLGRGEHRFELRASNLSFEPAGKSIRLKAGQPQTLQWKAAVINTNQPWAAVVIHNNDANDRMETAQTY
jgi:hypothetical protein